MPFPPRHEGLNITAGILKTVSLTSPIARVAPGSRDEPSQSKPLKPLKPPSHGRSLVLASSDVKQNCARSVLYAQFPR